jgi:hypothetical protein
VARKGISVKVDPPANKYVNHDTERIVEFFDWNTGQGGLIQFALTPDRNLRITVYRHTERVFVEEGQKERR